MCLPMQLHTIRRPYTNEECAFVLMHLKMRNKDTLLMPLRLWQPHFAIRLSRRWMNAAMSWRYTLVMPSKRHVPFAFL